MGVFLSTASHGFLTFCHEVCKSEEEEGESTFLSTKRDGHGGAGVKGERTTKIRKDHESQGSKKQCRIKGKIKILLPSFPRTVISP